MMDMVRTHYCCGHVEGTEEIVRETDFACRHCDPETYMLRVQFELIRSGLDVTEEQVRKAIAENLSDEIL